MQRFLRCNNLVQIFAYEFRLIRILYTIFFRFIDYLIYLLWSFIEVCVSTETLVGGKAWWTTALWAASDEIRFWFECWMASMASFSDSVVVSKWERSKFSGIPMPECKTNCSDMFRHSNVRSVTLLDGRFISFNWAKNFRFFNTFACIARNCDVVSSICLFESSSNLFFCIRLAFHRANSSTIKLKIQKKMKISK